MERPRRSPRPGLFWQGLLIVLPVALLAWFGFQTLRKDRLLLRLEARRQAEILASEALSQFWNQLSQASSNQPLFEIGPTGELLYPAHYAVRPIPQSHDEAEAWLAAWQEAQLEATPETWTNLLAADLPALWKERGRYELALCLAKQQDHGAHAIFEMIGNDAPDALSEAGLPLLPLALWKDWELLVKEDSQSPRVAEQLSRCLAETLKRPSVLTPMILNQAASLAPTEAARTEVERWQQQWKREELARSLYAKAAQSLPAGQWPPLVYLAGAPAYLLARQERPGNFYAALAVSEATPGRLSPPDDLLARLQPLLPAFLSLSLYLETQPQREPWPGPSGENVLADQFRGDLAGPHLRATVSLADPANFYARQRQRSLWFGALVFLSAVVATGGYLLARHSYLRQVTLNEMQANFVSSVSHELRSPIASLRLMSEGLQRGTVRDEARRTEYFRLMVQECRRLGTMIENVLTLSRSDRQRQEYEIEPTDLARLINETIALMTPMGTERDVQIQAQWNGSAPVQPNLDGRALQQALINLLDNALKHSPPGKAVTVGLHDTDRTVQIWVQDHGPGIPKAEQKKIFERFYRRGSELRRETPGIGIGLSIVQNIVEDMGGRVWVESVEGEGSRFITEFAKPEQQTIKRPKHGTNLNHRG